MSVVVERVGIHLGQSSISVTLNAYSNVIDEMKREAAESIDTFSGR